jgi:hypothetical protein
MTILPAMLTIVPLVPSVHVPHAASARTRGAIPPGYGVQEQCLPFTAASALGVLVPSPIRFGLCPLDEVPQGCRAFRSPLNQPAADGSFRDARVFYVFDNPACHFVGNAYTFKGVSEDGSPDSSVPEPGLSFFDREDLGHLFKLHLPYVWRTAESVDTLFLPPVNRSAHRLIVQCGLVETSWYPSPVNLVLSAPEGSLHIRAGDIVAQAILLPRNLRRTTLETAGKDDHIVGGIRKGLAVWDRQHAENRAAYKTLARSRHGRLEDDSATAPGEDGLP